MIVSVGIRNALVLNMEIDCNKMMKMESECRQKISDMGGSVQESKEDGEWFITVTLPLSCQSSSFNVRSGDCGLWEEERGKLS